MSAQHTPGPWHREGNHIVAGSVRIAVVDTPDIHAGVDAEEAEANGAVKLSVIFADRRGGMPTKGQWEVLEKKLRAAFAKAAGSAQ